jgi:hydroxymethylpyrimidine/phosphomethylpyrimidine kinase
MTTENVGRYVLLPRAIIATNNMLNTLALVCYGPSTHIRRKRTFAALNVIVKTRNVVILTHHSTITTYSYEGGSRFRLPKAHIQTNNTPDTLTLIYNQSSTVTSKQPGLYAARQISLIHYRVRTYYLKKAVPSSLSSNCRVY